MSDLTPSQREAVEHVDGPLLVLAGAGSGKTRVITRRVARLIEHGVAPQRILAITFTNKAAGEMRERTEALTGGARVWVSTFHAFCARTLRRYGEHVGVAREFSILDDADQKAVIREALNENNHDPKQFPINSLLHRISQAKDALKTPKDLEDDALTRFDHVAAEVYTYYEDALAQSDALDFGGLLTKTVELLSKEGIGQAIADRHQYVLIDEYQDTNHAQYRIARLLAQSHDNMCATGDPNQAIYGWRGADIRNILTFEKDYPSAKVVKLEDNFRSTKLILEAANGLISHNTERRDTSLRTRGEEGVPLRYQVARDDQDEGRWVAQDIGLRLGEGVSPSEIAVFYRANSLSRSLEVALLERGIPHEVIGAVAFYQRKEIKDVLAYLRLTHNPKDDMAFQRVVNTPTRGVGKTTVERIKERARSARLSLLEASEALIAEKGKVKGKSKRGLQAFCALVRGLHDKAQQDRTVESAVRAILDDLDYAAYLAKEYPEEYERVENLESLIGGAREFDVEHPPQDLPPLSPEPSAEPDPEGDADFAFGANAGGDTDFAFGANVSGDTGFDFGANVPTGEVLAMEEEVNPGGIPGFLEHVALVTALESRRQEGPRVSLMTVHMAKGLEFDHVYVIGMEEGMFPNARATEDPTGIEEERRLAYVAITRARKRVSLTRANYRTRWGQPLTPEPSVFLLELPMEVFPAGESPHEQEQAQSRVADDDDFLGIDAPSPDYEPPSWQRSLRKRDGSSLRSSSSGDLRSTSTSSGPLRLGAKTTGIVPGRGAGATPKPSAKSMSFAAGDRVDHEHFGRGQVVSVRGAGPNQRAKIHFDGFGTKELVLQYARMNKLT